MRYPDRMRIWSTFRFVPVISPEAMAWATLSFATYLAAIEMRPTVFGTEVAPLALALAVQLTLSITKNITHDRFARNAAAYPKAVAFWLVLIFAGFGALAVSASDAFAAKFYALYTLSHALALAVTAIYNHPGLPNVVGTWIHTKQNVQTAVLIEAAGQVVIAFTLLTVWTFAGTFAYAAMMSFGMLAAKTLVNWIIVLYLLDVQARSDDE